MATTTGHGHPTGYQRGCEACQRASREDKRALRARNRGFDPEPELEPEPPALTVVEPVEPDHSPAAPAERVFGRVEAAVQADLDGLGISVGSNALAAAALQMGRILDDRRLVTTQPSAARQLERFMTVLRREATPKRGRLAAVQKMTSRPDAAG
jgi:hypothetical protein